MTTASIDTFEPVAPAPSRLEIVRQVILARPATLFAAIVILIFVVIALLARHPRSAEGRVQMRPASPAHGYC